MSEPMQPQEPKVEQTVAPATIPDNILKDAVANAVKSETEKIRAELQGAISPEKVQEILQEDRKRLADQISGRASEPQVNPIHSRFVNDPEGFVGAIGEITLKKIEEQRELERQQFEEAERVRNEMKTAFEEVVSSRKDILSNEASKQVWGSLYAKTDSSKPEADRMREALVSYDKYMDELGVDRSKLSKNLSVDGSGMMPQGIQAAPQSFEDSMRQSQKEKHAAYLKTIGRD